MLPRSLIATLTLTALSLSCPPAAAQDPVSTLKRQIDGLVAEVAKAPPETALGAAKFLIAAVRCPRRYDLSDGPFMRGPKDLLMKARRNNGLFGTGSAPEVRETTAWAWQALSELDEKDLAEVLSSTRQAFAKEYGLDGAKLDAALRPYSPRGYAGRMDSSDLVEILLTRVAELEVLEQQKQREAKLPPWEEFQQKGLDWLVGRMQDGKLLVPGGPKGELVADPGMTALGLAALASKPAKLRSEAENAQLDKGVAFLLASQQEDGSFSSYLPNYVTCTAILALSRSGRTDVAKALQKAQQFLLTIQMVERGGFVKGDRDYGSIGYGDDRRGDLSNTQFALDALRQTGLPAQHEAIEKALVFLRRCQNMPGEGSYSGTRRTEDGRKVSVVPGTDGGAAYYPGDSKFGYDETSDGSQVARSYGSMTYALLKCYILAGLPKEDPRLQAALNWCSTNFTVDENPGAKAGGEEKTRYQGLYYYYLTMSRALGLSGINDIKGVDWRAALRKKLRAEQQADGSWINTRNGRWWEDNPLIATAYALLALSE